MPLKYITCIYALGIDVFIRGLGREISLFLRSNKLNHII
jgi:hypothetical protein